MRRILCLVILAIGSSVWANAQNLTIADIARRERARKEAKAKGVVINNKTLGISEEVANKRAAEPQPPAPHPLLGLLPHIPSAPFPSMPLAHSLRTSERAKESLTIDETL